MARGFAFAVTLVTLCYPIEPYVTLSPDKGNTIDIQGFQRFRRALLPYKRFPQTFQKFLHDFPTILCRYPYAAY